MDDFRKPVEIMARLRGEGGCEWDRAQTHETLRQYIVEETHEVVDAIRRNDPALLCEELGDLLLQILFHARIAQEYREFEISDVIASICRPLLHRLPRGHQGSSAHRAPEEGGLHRMPLRGVGDVREEPPRGHRRAETGG